jgi:hypothetical protein
MPQERAPKGKISVITEDSPTPASVQTAARQIRNRRVFFIGFSGKTIDKKYKT